MSCILESSPVSFPPVVQYLLAVRHAKRRLQGSTCDRVGPFMGT